MDKSGPAFPTMRYDDELGLSKRELFAAMAMQGLINQTDAARCMYDAVAEFAVKHADALLAELEKEEK